MPSNALIRWRVERGVRLDHWDAHCANLCPNPLVVPSSAAEQGLQAYVLLLSGHFQGFCRNLYVECSGLYVNAVPTGLREGVETQFAADLRLDTGNPTIEAIRHDFERFGVALDLVGTDHINSSRITHVGHLNVWRNVVAHQKKSPTHGGVPPALTLPQIRTWRKACDGLATSLDGIMQGIVSGAFGAAPW